MAHIPSLNISNAGVTISTPGNVSISASSVATAGYVTSAFNSNGSIASNPRYHGMEVKGTLSADEINIDGVSLKETLAGIQARLAILVPDPVMLEKYEALRNAYNTYKTLEALCK